MRAERLLSILFRLQILTKKTQTGTLEISCSKGTYVRTIIDDIGRVLGVGAVMTALCRTSACGFSLDECITLDELKSILRKRKC